MTSASEAFVVQLARVSEHAKRQLRGLSSVDRDDVISMAVLWCWEHRNQYKPELSLEMWFTGAMRDARKKFTTEEERQGHVTLDVMQSLDPEAQAMSAQSLKNLNAHLKRDEKKIASLIAQGYTRAEVRERLGGLDNQTFARVKAKVRELRPDDGRPMLVHGPSGATHVRPDSESGTAPNVPSSIDRAIARLDFPPHEGADCPPCWKCCYFLGFKPRNYKPTKLADEQVQVAVRATEAEKIRIAG